MPSQPSAPPLLTFTVLARHRFRHNAVSCVYAELTVVRLLLVVLVARRERTSTR